jgi:hypothetical protein
LESLGVSLEAHKENLAKVLYVVGIAKDCGSTIQREIPRLKKVFSPMFDEIYFHVIESDSSDGTAEVLAKLQVTHPTLSFETLGNLSKFYPDRIARLRFCRNQYVNFLRKFLSHTYAESHVLVVDLDIRNNALSRNALQKALASLQSWDALFANQRGLYYDIFALRHETWNNVNSAKEVLRLSPSLGKTAAKQVAIWDKMKRINPSSAPIQVQSAFGGMGLYKSWIFREFDYSEDGETDAFECEHVTLHRKVTAAGGSLWIAPALTNFSWNLHNLSAFPTLRTLDRISKTKTLKPIRKKIRMLLG